MSEMPEVDFAKPIEEIRAEQCVLGAILANNRAFHMVDELLEPHHFYIPAHARLYELLREAIRRGQTVDAVVARSMISADPAWVALEKPTYLVDLLAAVIGFINLTSYAGVIRDAWGRREFAMIARETALRCHAPTEAGFAEVKEYLESEMSRVDQGLGDSTPLASFGDAVAEAVAGARAAAARGNGLAGMTTGYRALDRMTMGLMPSQMIVLAARPSMGKTALGLGIAVRAAAAGHRVGFWSGEMTAPQLGARAAAAAAWLPTTSVFTGRGYTIPEEVHRSEVRDLEPYEWNDLDRAAVAAGQLPLWVDARPGITVGALRARARREKRTRGLDLLVVDYLGLMRCSPALRSKDLHVQVGEIANDLKALAVELHIPVLVLVQLSRANEQREDKRPNLADLRDSGVIEQNADVTAFIYREHYYLTRGGKEPRRKGESDEDYGNRLSEVQHRTNQAKGVAEIIITKQRQGPIGVTRLRFVDHTTWFYDEGEPDRAAAWPDPGGM